MEEFLVGLFAAAAVVVGVVAAGHSLPFLADRTEAPAVAEGTASRPCPSVRGPACSLDSGEEVATCMADWEGRVRLLAVAELSRGCWTYHTGASASSP